MTLNERQLVPVLAVLKDIKGVTSHAPWRHIHTHTVEVQMMSDCFLVLPNQKTSKKFTTFANTSFKIFKTQNCSFAECFCNASCNCCKCTKHSLPFFPSIKPLLCQGIHLILPVTPPKLSVVLPLLFVLKGWKDGTPQQSQNLKHKCRNFHGGCNSCHVDLSNLGCHQSISTTTTTTHCTSIKN